MITLHKAIYGPKKTIVKGPQILVDPSHIILVSPTKTGSTFITLSNRSVRQFGVFESLEEIKQLIK